MDGGALVRTGHSVFRLRRRDGHVREAWSPEGTMRGAVAVGDRLFVVSEADGKQRLVVRRHGRTQSEHASPEFGFESLHYVPTTNLIYDCCIKGLGILDPRTGERLFEFTGVNNVAHVDANRFSIFMLDGRGVVRALRQPVGPTSPTRFRQAHHR